MKRTTDSYEAAHAALNIIEILSGIAACLAERGLGETGDFEPEDLRNASQCSSLWLHAFRPFSYRDVYLGPSLYKGGDPNRTALRFLDLLEMTGCNRHVRTFRVAFTRLTTRSRSSAHDEGPRPEIVANILSQCPRTEMLYLNYIDPRREDILLPALLTLSHLRSASLSHTLIDNGIQAPLLDTYASVFAANPQLRTLTLRSIASAPTASHPNIPTLVHPPSQLQAVQLQSLTLRDFWITNPELESLLSTQKHLQHLVLSRPSHLSLDPIKGILAGVAPIKAQLLTLAIDGFPIGSALALLQLALPSLEHVTVEEQKLNRGAAIDALPPTVRSLALYRTDFGAAHTSAFVGNLKRYLARGNAKLEAFRCPKWGLQAKTQRETLFKLGKKYGVHINLE